MKENKKPDNVVFNEETQEYHGKLSPFATSVSAPKITPPDVSSWKNTHIVSANNQFKAQYEELQKSYKALMDDFEYNNLVYSAKFNFEPIVGKEYHLYSAKDESTFLSLIPPNECTFEHLGSFRLTGDKTWEKI
ncbi:DUF2452 domain-containing protein [Maribacter sp. ACAM166]|uniref:DUF2452 domain-containing protein n=1 Tax=Maribacter sp. ACAM166 TaxID=2508996 RepID=UPI0010FE290C|nr:DUF2452 domain-containing protein [Maribacter sp. ACAM166]TLP79203.1 DUF2452 domain-containing protein [Maribacter sp. ACAM166]